MKKQTSIVLVFAALLATVSNSAQAQSDRLIGANVPFNFMIKDRALPAGEYVFALVKFAGSDAIKIQSADGHITAFVPTRSTGARQNRVEARLVFNRYEDRYFLAQVSGLDGSGSQQQLSPSRAEKELAKAGNDSRRTEVSVGPSQKP